MTSRRTFSASEALAYDMQALKRATIVGETTGGGAHGTTIYRITDHFSASIPFCRAINPVRNPRIAAAAPLFSGRLSLLARDSISRAVRSRGY